LTLAEALGRPLTEVFQIIDATTREPARNPVDQAIQLDRIVTLAPNCLLIRRDGIVKLTDYGIAHLVRPTHGERGAVSRRGRRASNEATALVPSGGTLTIPTSDSAADNAEAVFNETAVR
jgi:hypothetical protein